MKPLATFLFSALISLSFIACESKGNSTQLSIINSTIKSSQKDTTSYNHYSWLTFYEAENFMSGMFQNMEQDDRVRDEYFAMAIVYFFELPIAFKQKYTALYDAMSNLLGQDPAKKMGRK